MAVGIEELDRDLAAGAAAAFVGDFGALRLQVIAGADTSSSVASSKAR